MHVVVIHVLGPFQVSGNLHSQLLESGVGGIESASLFQRVNTLVADVPGRVKIRLADSQRNRVFHFRYNVKESADAGGLQADCFIA